MAAVPNIFPDLSKITAAIGRAPSGPFCPFELTIVPPKSCRSWYVPDLDIFHRTPELFGPPAVAVPYMFPAVSKVTPEFELVPSGPLDPFAIVTVPPKECSVVQVPDFASSQTVPREFAPPYADVPYILPAVSIVTLPYGEFPSWLVAAKSCKSKYAPDLVISQTMPSPF